MSGGQIKQYLINFILQSAAEQVRILSCLRPEIAKYHCRKASFGRLDELSTVSLVCSWAHSSDYHYCTLYIFILSIFDVFTTLLIFVCKILQTDKGLPTSLKSILERKRIELKKHIKVTESLLRELEIRHILTHENITRIKVSC